jgi:arylsulfatase A-like enzyme/Tfp pilus assembly protein PilF
MDARKVALCLLAALLAGNGTGKSAAPSRPNVILLTIDTLRADRLGCYGYRGVQTPGIDAIAAEGILFKTAVAQVPLTLPSHCTILTGTYPTFHQVRDNVGYRLDASKTTLAEMLKPLGYRTAAFVGAYVLNSRFGLNQGFDTYDDVAAARESAAGLVNLNSVERRAGEVIDHAIRWIRGKTGSPFFAWIHLFDPHDPYDPPLPFKSMYRANPYDGEIAYVDQQVGRLTAFLKSEDLYGSSLILLVGDHGESFGEHGEYTHGFFVYDTTLLVPLIVKMPGAAGQVRVVGQQVRTVDVAPTILQILGAPAAPEVQGAGMLGLLLGRKSDVSREAYSETYYPLQFGWSPLRSLRLPEAKYISAPRPELYDLKQDPAEISNSLQSNAALANGMKERLGRLESVYSDRRSAQAGGNLPVEPDELEKLAALSYVGGVLSAGSRAVNFGKLPDPKDRLPIFQLISEAGRDAARGRYGQAILNLQRVTADDPAVAAAWMLLGRCHYAQKAYEPARRAFARLVALQPQSLEGLFFVAACDFYLKRMQEAEAGLQKVLKLNPNYSYAHKYLGFLYQAEGKTGAAIREFRAVADMAPDDEEAQLKLGFLYASMSQFDQAVVHFKRAVALNPENAATHYNLGLAYMRTNQPDPARTELDKACRLDKRYCVP